ncbi:MAG TPA: DUF882 domain-containing protein [Polyangiaceae bacterium]|jgi:uncharacterized protein YcbK (DUF882 family)
MRATHVARPLAFTVVLASSVAMAQPPSRAKRPPAQAGLRANSAPALAYMAGKQGLIGCHAPSEKPVPRDATGRPMLALRTLNRNESLAVPVAGDEGGFASADLDAIAHLLRAMNGDEHPIDPRTLGIVYRIEIHFAAPEVRVVSGYRIPKPGSRSNHGRGRAMDIVVPGVPDEEVARFARDLGFVGVGVYPSSQFVHVDIRPRSYFWVDYSGPHMRNRELGILSDLAAKNDEAARARGVAPVEPFGIATNVDDALDTRERAGSVAAAQDDEDED